MLEAELMNMGANINDEQEVLRADLQAQEKASRRARSPDEEVALLLGNVAGDHSLGSMGVVEVC